MLKPPGLSLIPTEKDLFGWERLTDWIEGCLLFTDEESLSQPYVADFLKDCGLTEKRSPFTVVEQAWSALRYRAKCLENSVPYTVSNGVVTRRGRDWKATPAYSFCLALSLAGLYPSFRERLGPDHTGRGRLFEQLTEAALRSLLPGWSIWVTGWSPVNTNKIRQVVTQVSTLACEPELPLYPWMTGRENEAGLDIVCCREFDDGKPSIPTLLVQCASGELDRSKFETPNIDVWSGVVEFSCRPQRAYSTPYALNRDHYRHVSKRVQGLTLDRLRLFHGGRANTNWLPAGLADSLVEWLEPRVQHLPVAST